LAMKTTDEVNVLTWIRMFWMRPDVSQNE
jgi:hypothetical protein